MYLNACMCFNRAGRLPFSRWPGRRLFQAGLTVISAPKLCQFQFTHSFVHLFKDDLLGPHTEPRYDTTSQDIIIEHIEELTVKSQHQTSEVVVPTGCGECERGVHRAL